MVLFKFSERALGLISTIVLARLLVPADFGLIAMAMSIAGVLEVLTSFGFDLALIQNQKAEQRHYDTAWTFNVIAGAFMALSLIVLAQPAATFYAEARVKEVMYFLAVCMFIQGFSNIGTIAFQKDLELHKEFGLGILKKLIQIGVGLGIAWYIPSYWALLLGILASRIAGVGLSYAMHPYRPRFCLAATRDLFHFSKWILVNSLLIFVNNRGIDLVIGRIAGANAVGLYSVSYEISNLPTTELVFPLMRAIYPGYAKVASDLPRLREMFLRVLNVTALIAMPIGFLIALFAEPIVFILLGKKWNETVPLVEILAVCGVVRALYGGTGSVYVAINRPGLVGVVNVIFMIVGIPLAIALLYYFGVATVPYALLAAALCAAAANFRICCRVLCLRMRDLVRAIRRPLIGTTVLVVLSVVVRAVPLTSDVGWRLAVEQMVLMALVGVAYVGTVVLAWHVGGRAEGPEAEIARMIRLRRAGGGPGVL